MKESSVSHIDLLVSVIFKYENHQIENLYCLKDFKLIRFLLTKFNLTQHLKKNLLESICLFNK